MLEQLKDTVETGYICRSTKEVMRPFYGTTSLKLFDSALEEDANLSLPKKLIRVGQVDFSKKLLVIYNPAAGR